MIDTCLGFGQETACGIAYSVDGAGRNPQDIRSGVAIQVTGTVTEVTCAACDMAFTVYTRSRGLKV